MFPRLTRRRILIVAFTLSAVAAGLGWRLLPLARATAAGITTLAGNIGTYTQYPVTGITGQPPLAMLVMSRDEQLSVRAYTDYTDINGDGLIDTTYNNTLTYSGYFDSNLCYSYSSSTFFIASAQANNHQCSGFWSGNFLNWLSMTRLDLVRFVLYGGKRAIDTASQTVLQRAYVPNDNHAWVKVYNGADVGQYTPFSTAPVSFCNLSPRLSSSSAASADNPTLRVAQGSFSQWSLAEVTECQWREDYNAPQNPSRASNGLGQKDYAVKVDVCDNSNSSLREAFCREYDDSSGSAHYKPAGLLQQFGEQGQIRFGLITGSYRKPRSGGLLRRNIGLLADNGGASDCSNPANEVNLNNGSFCNQGSGASGIINTLNRLQVSQYNGTNNYNDCSTFGIYNRQGQGGNGNLNDPGQSGGGSYNCSDWGNPLAEMYAEALRYIANPGGGGALAPFGTYQPSGSSALGLPSGLSWAPPYDSTDSCATCSIIVFSTGLDSFDTDELPDMTNVLGTTAQAATTTVGSNEGINGQYLIGRVGTTPVGTSLDTQEDQCTAKTLTDLNLARGICPEIPSLEGGYQLAGLAYKAWTTDLRPDLPGIQRTQTYAVSLADQLPSFTIPVGGKTITLVPSCQANNNGGATLSTATGWRSCSIANLLVGARRADVSPNYRYGQDQPGDASRGSFLVAWDDSSWGNDHDLDVQDMVTYCAGASCNFSNDGDGTKGICWRSNSPYCQANADTNGVLTTAPASDTVLVRVEVLSAFAGNALRVGFSVSGSASDGNQLIVLRPGNRNDSLLTNTADPICSPGCPNSSYWTPPQVLSFKVGNNDVGQLQNPLFYAAKYGAFTYPDGASNPLPTSVTQWDQINNETGAQGSDGLPDNYFPVRNPSQLGIRLAAVFQAILKRAGSGTAAAVVANEREGIGATYQALYEPSRTDNQGRSVSWIGSLQALLVDSRGRLREDAYGTHSLDEADFSANPVVQILFDPNTNTTVIHRWTVDPDTNPAAFTTAPLDQLQPLWNARDQLASNALTAGITSNRTYSASASSGRYIFTCIDTSLSGCNGGDVQPFVTGTFTGNNYGILDVSSLAQAQQVVNYIRGQEQPGLRSRTIDYFNNGQPEVMRLGDIVNSTPTVVAAPSESFDVLFDDQTYHNFFTQYKNRRNVVYVGANDGMLHAFNGGFFDQATHGFNTSPPSGQSGTADPLGSELWAYVPFNLLPHLQWLTDPKYTHVWYVDDKPRAFDARIFNSDATHPDGWGTVLVVGMRMGGANLQLPEKCNGGFMDFSGCGSNATLTTHSAYVILDVTDLEQPPTLLAEISDPNTSTTSKIGFTTSYPTVMAFRPDVTATGSGSDQWYLVFGNGPTDLTNAVSNNDAGLYLYDLRQKTFVSGFSPLDLHNALESSGSTGYTNSFVGDPVSVDWNLDFNADAVYVGTAGGTAANPTGRLVKLTTGCLSGASGCSSPGGWSVTTLLNPNAPALATPTVTQDEQGRHWVIDGTGRLFVGTDKASSAQQYLFGVVDTLDRGAASPPAFSSLVDTTNAQVATDGTVSGVTVGGQSVTDQISLAAAAASAGGWKLSLSTNGSNPSERSLSSGDLIGNIFFDSTFVPDLNTCVSLGAASLYGLYYKTGAAFQQPVFGTRQIVINGNTTTVSIGKIDLGKGLGAAPTLHLGTTANGQVTVFTQTSTGAIVQSNAQVGPSAKSGETDWREDHGP